MQDTRTTLLIYYTPDPDASSQTTFKYFHNFEAIDKSLLPHLCEENHPIDVGVSPHSRNLVRTTIHFSIEDILAGLCVINTLKISTRSQTVELDMHGIESLYKLRYVDLSGSRLVVDSLQGIEYCTELEEVVLHGVRASEGGISLAPLSSHCLECLDITNSHVLDLETVRTRNLRLDLKQTALLECVKETSGIHKIRITGEDIINELRKSEEYQVIALRAQKRIRKHCPEAEIEYVIRIDPMPPHVRTLDDILDFVDLIVC